ncbi:hypothetical protein CBR_g88534 [Chara braunii]|uniref:Large ribosomal subunit protein uL13c n=1 Tax=Chara braunii TaxID=69332 RepID=A0A388KB07_CHABU|nr:hypothetical protein CBR_g88534 [Chara braunii]|eukprot:GBG67245.1 hypothetical protein CBR_g88534 [Chara braunii]
MTAAMAMSSSLSSLRISAGASAVASTCSSPQTASGGNADNAAALANPSPRCNLSSSLSCCKGSVFAGKRKGLEAGIVRAERRVQVQGLSVRCQGRFIPAEWRHLYEGVEKLGPDVWNNTYYPKAEEHINKEKKWFVVDASDMVLGRLASNIAVCIRGKNLPTYTPSIDMGAYVVVVNAEKVKVTGRKNLQKIYRRHSGRPGGMKEETFQALQQRLPERIIEHAVRGMLPKGRLGRRLFTHLKVYKGAEHPHEAQQPQPLKITDKKCLAIASKQ